MNASRREHRFRPRLGSLEPRALLSAYVLAASPPGTVTTMSALGSVVRPPPPGALGSGVVDATAWVQGWINATPAYGTLELPAGTYLVSQPILITKPMTLTTRGLAQAPVDPFAGGRLDVSKYATIKASAKLVFGCTWPGFNQDKGVLVVHPPSGQATLSNVNIRYIALDGNDEQRRAADPKTRVADQWNCSNLNMQRTDNSSFSNCVSFHSLTHGNDPYTHIFVDCNNLHINDNFIYQNGHVPIGSLPPAYFGDHFGTNSLEVQAVTRDVRGLEILRNRVYDHTGQGIVMRVDAGRTMTGQIAYNSILQLQAMSWGVAILLYRSGSYGNGAIADPRTTLLVHHNLIDGNAAGATIPGTKTRIRQIPYGIILGDGPFVFPDRLILRSDHFGGGRIYANTIRNVQVGITVDQAGLLNNPTYVIDNIVGGSTGLPYNKAPEEANHPHPNVIVANAGCVLDSSGNLVQTGPLRLWTANYRPAFWSDLVTRAAAFGAVPSLVAVAPKPMPSTPLFWS